MQTLSKRDAQLQYAKIAGYHSDSSTFTRIRIERKGVSFEALKEAWFVGVQAKRNGMKCTCRDCKEA